ncbi:MAG: hypothetical protein ACOYXW_05785 [Actinomycetota bacterium]
MSTAPGQTPLPALPGSDDDPGTGPAVRSLFTALVDDAAVFPPGLAPMADAVPAHLRHRAAWYADVVGPFLVPAGAVEAFSAAARAAGAALRVGVVADPRTDDPLAGALDAVRSLERLDGVDVVALEVPLARGADPASAAAELLARVPSGVRTWVEVHREPGWERALDAVAAAGDDVGAKLRTGGTTPEAFPSVEELAAFLRRAVDVDLTFKLTAGLHTAVRGPDATGATHHGVLNVIGAVRAALNGAEAPEVARVLAETSAARLASAARRMSEADAAVLRAFFASFGCCGVTDPVGELAGLGLLEEVPA